MIRVENELCLEEGSEGGGRGLFQCAVQEV
jgi:hypothetical protein